MFTYLFIYLLFNDLISIRTLNSLLWLHFAANVVTYHFFRT